MGRAARFSFERHLVEGQVFCFFFFYSTDVKPDTSFYAPSNHLQRIVQRRPIRTKDNSVPFVWVCPSQDQNARQEAAVHPTHDRMRYLECTRS